MKTESRMIDGTRGMIVFIGFPLQGNSFTSTALYILIVASTF